MARSRVLKVLPMMKLKQGKLLFKTWNVG